MPGSTSKASHHLGFVVSNHMGALQADSVSSFVCEVIGGIDLPSEPPLVVGLEGSKSVASAFILGSSGLLLLED